MQTFPTLLTPLAIPWKKFPLCSPLLSVNHNGGSYFSPPASASPLSSFPHRSDGRLGKGISMPHCQLPHPRRTRALPRVWALPSPAGTKSHLTQTPTENHRSPVRCAHHHQPQGPSYMPPTVLDQSQYRHIIFTSNRKDVSDISINVLSSYMLPKTRGQLQYGMTILISKEIIYLTF